MKPVKIEFQRSPIWEFIDPIMPASQALPVWYKQAQIDIPEAKEYFGTHLTFKGCPAILDSMVQGYILPLWTDVWVEPTDDFIDGKRVPRFSWGETINDMVVQTQNPSASKEMASFQGLSTSPMTLKFNSPWLVKTPKDYSMLMVPPLNNRDSRFEPVSGVVCTDEFTTYMNVPFIWTAPSDYEGVIKAGTPLVQMIPFKREVFQQEIGFTTDDGEKLLQREQACARKVGSVFRNGYRRFFQKTALSR